MFIRPRRKDYHQAMLDHMNAAHYPDVKNGVCFGIAGMGLQAILLRDTETFSKRIVALEKPANNMTSAAIKNIRLHGYSTHAFFDGVAVYQNPHLYEELFHRRARVNQDITATSSYLIPQVLEKKGGIIEVGNFCGLYSQSSLCKTLKSLRRQLTYNKIVFPVGLVLCKHDHALTIGFDPDHNKWALIEANVGPVQWLRDHELATMIKRLFSKNDAIIFDAKIYSVGNNQRAAKNIISAWMLSAAYLQHHVITPESALEKDSDSATLLYISAQNGRLNVVKELLNNGADINYSSHNMPSALYIAALNGHLDVVNELLDHGAYVNADYYSGVSPLIAAAISKHVDIAIALLDHGADFNEISHNRKFLRLLRNESDTGSNVKIR